MRVSRPLLLRVLALSCAFVLLTPRLALADPSAADAHIVRGIDLRQNQKDAEALEEFKAAYELSQGMEALTQMGLAEQALGRWVDAEAHLAEALASRNDPWVNRNRALLDGQLAMVSKRLGDLEIIGNVPGAEIKIDGRSVGALPMSKPVRVETGTVRVEALAAGYHTVTRSVAVEQGMLTRESVSLVPLQGVAPPPTAPVVASPDTGSGAAPRPPDAPASAAPPSWKRTTGWIALAGAGVATVGATVALVVQRGNAAHWNDDARCLRGGGATRADQCAGVRDSAQLAGGLAVTGYVVGGTLAIVAVAAFLTAPDAGRRSAVPPANLGVALGPGSAGLEWAGRF